MLKYTEADVIIDGVKIHYYRTGGAKPPVILLHGATDNGLCWRTTAEMLAEKYDVVMPDAQGHDLSDRLDKDFSFQNHADQVAGLAKQLGLKKPIIMGHSMGAGTAVNVAVSCPDLPGAIILEDPAWLIQDSGGPVKPPVDPREYLTSLSKKTLEELMAECRAANPGWADAEIRPWAESKLQFDPGLFDFMVINPGSYKEQVPKIRCPALLIIAESGLVSRATAEEAARIWKSKKPFRWVQITGAGHNIRRENFPAYREAVLKFLKDISA
ncbi:MAG: alpha/beta hydrolase [Dehalococcoidales bacterium]|nr:alpha/beta hydrolase [Dehalococcoidales bacterium]